MKNVFACNFIKLSEVPRKCHSHQTQTFYSFYTYCSQTDKYANSPSPIILYSWCCMFDHFPYEFFFYYQFDKISPHKHPAVPMQRWRKRMHFYLFFHCIFAISTSTFRTGVHLINHHVKLLVHFCSVVIQIEKALFSCSQVKLLVIYHFFTFSQIKSFWIQNEKLPINK